jgi:hypothetical protein
MDFIRIKNKNQYQREQSIQFFNKLQTLKPFLNIVTNNEFQSYVIFFNFNTVHRFRLLNAKLNPL